MIELLWNNPISKDKMAKYLAALKLKREQRVLDVGCGSGEILIQIHERYGVYGLGIDSDELLINEARRRSVGRADVERLRFEVEDASNLEAKNSSEENPFEERSFDVIVCMGASHAFGLGSEAYQNALLEMRPMLTNGGLLWIGEGYLRQPACDDYRQLIGDSQPDEKTHAHNVETATRLGFRPVAAWTSSFEEWDDFEWGYQQIVERKASEGDIASLNKLNGRRQWMNAYLRWGRDTLGFGVYLLRKE